MRHGFRHIGILAISAFSLAACETAGVSPVGGPSEAEVNAAISAQISCMRDRTLRLDDGVSDARKVGKAVASACRAESRRASEVFISGKSPDAQAEFLRTAREGEAELATRVVLQTRALKS